MTKPWSNMKSFQKYGPHVIFALFFIFAFITGLIGIDFGFHWDEFKIIDSVKESVKTGVYLPGWYNYPSVSYGLTLSSIVPHTAYFIAKRLPGPVTGVEIGQFIQNYLNDPGIYLDVRRIFLLVVLFSSLWIYLLIYTWRRNWWEAVVGAVVFLASWEMAYHARWIAPDGILMQFGILTILLIFVALRNHGHVKLIWLGLAAITAGLAAGTKYYGGLFIVPVLLGVWDYARSHKRPIPLMLAIAATLGVIFAVTFLLSTPAAFVTPAKLIADVQFEMNHYREGHGGYTVDSSLEHAYLLLIYLSSEAFSKYTLPALLLFGLSITGLGWVAARVRADSTERIPAAVFFCVPVLFFPYIISQNVMIVRNDMLFLPFLAVLCARGTAWLYSKLSQRFRITLVVALCALLLANSIYLFTVADSIKHMNQINYSVTLVEYMNEHPESAFYLSSSVQKILQKPGTIAPANLVAEPKDADYYLFSSRDVAEWWLLPANKKGLYGVIAGPDDVNFDYYPTWAGQFRIVSLPMDIALQSEVIR